MITSHSTITLPIRSSGIGGVWRAARRVVHSQVDEFMRFEDAYTLEGVETELQSLYKHFMKFKDSLRL